MRRAGLGDEAGGQQSGQLRSDVGDGLGLGRRWIVGQRHLRGVQCSEHSLHPPQDVGGHRRDTVAHPLAGDGELLPGPHRLGGQHVDGGVGTVVQQRGQRAIGVGAQGQTAPRVELLLQ